MADAMMRLLREGLPQYELLGVLERGGQGIVLKAQHRLALTGTPVENRLSELWSIMQFLNPGYLGARDAFRKRFALPIERYADRAATARLKTLRAQKAALAPGQRPPSPLELELAKIGAEVQESGVCARPK